jgi:hypothetical protein
VKRAEAARVVEAVDMKLAVVPRLVRHLAWTMAAMERAMLKEEASATLRGRPMATVEEKRQHFELKLDKSDFGNWSGWECLSYSAGQKDFENSRGDLRHLCDRKHLAEKEQQEESEEEAVEEHM